MTRFHKITIAIFCGGILLSGGFGGAGVFFHESFLTCSAADIYHGRPQLFEALDKGDFFDLTVPDVRLEALLGEH